MLWASLLVCLCTGFNFDDNAKTKLGQALAGGVLGSALGAVGGATSLGSSGAQPEAQVTILLSKVFWSIFIY